MNSQLKTIIVDDDKFQLEILSQFVKKTNFLALENSFSDPLTALEVIINTPPDILLLDIEMPNLNGLELLKSIPNPPKTIIISGNKKHALEAFELDVIDYLVKPVDDYSRFLKAINKAKHAKSEQVEVKTTTLNDQIYVREDSLLISILLKEVMYFEAFGDYVKIATEDKIYTIHSTLSKIHARIPEDFIKVHRSFIVQLKQIKNIDQTNLQIGEKIIPISLSMRPHLMSRIETF